MHGLSAPSSSIWCVSSTVDPDLVEHMFMSQVIYEQGCVLPLNIDAGYNVQHHCTTDRSSCILLPEAIGPPLLIVQIYT